MAIIDLRLKDRVSIIKIFFGVIIALLMFKLFQIQIWDKSFKIKADATAIQQKTIYPSRGLIYDRHHELMAFNEPVFDIYFTYNQLNPNQDTARLCRLLQISNKKYNEAIQVNWSSNQYSKNIPTIFLKKVSAKVVSVFQEHLNEYPGFELKVRNIRAYPNFSSAHILGYINEVNKKQIEASNGVYTSGDFLGVTGLEKAYEPELRGKKGIDYILKDNLGRTVSNYQFGSYNVDAVSGKDLYLSIDLDLQRFGEELMHDRIGSIVAIEPKTGDILSMISAPDYDPALLAMNKDRGEAYRKLSRDSLQPFFNRAISAKYPPGSIFKPILALIGLQEKIISVDRYINCSGAYQYKTYSWGCHAGPSISNVVQAIQISCNTFFYQIYRELIDLYGFNKPTYGLDKVHDHLAKFGLGKKLGIDLPGENTGLNPDTEFYNKMYQEEEGRWRSTYLISNGIGQGEIELTTLQMANLATIIANRGYYYTPHLLKSFHSSTGDEVVRYPLHQTEIDQEHFEPVIEGMHRAISTGTAGMARVPGLSVCGKTGTSENRGIDHSVFFAFAPRENPKIALAVYIEHGGWGGSVAAPIAGLMIEKYLQDSISPHRQWLLHQMISKDNS